MFIHQIIALEIYSFHRFACHHAIC